MLLHFRNKRRIVSPHVSRNSIGIGQVFHSSRGISGVACGGTSGRSGHEPAKAQNRFRRVSKSASNGSRSTPPEAVCEIAASLPGSRNSRGNRAAWEPPWRNNLARVTTVDMSTHRYTKSPKVKRRPSSTEILSPRAAPPPKSHHVNQRKKSATHQEAVAAQSDQVPSHGRVVTLNIRHAQRPGLPARVTAPRSFCPR